MDVADLDGADLGCGARIVVGAWIAKIVLGLINGGAVVLVQQMTGEIEF